MNRFMRFIAALIAAVLMTAGFASASEAYIQDMEMRAVWVSTVYNLDYPNSATTDPAALRAQADRIIANCKSMGMNAVILQVRPSADAFYPSAYFPWSKYLTGRQGTAPEDGFDPLEYWISAAHANDIELHAWINPFRIAMSKADFDALSDEHPARKNPDWVVSHSNGQYYFDPGIPAARELIINGVREIVERYDVDGIHLDDYFYPDPSFDDEETFADHGSGFKERDDWRRDNVNRLISEIDRICGELDFGVSVAGIWANESKIEGGSATGGNQSYASNFADSRRWVKEGWVDYICPQIYWYIGHRLADYETLANWWAETVRGTDVKLYIGMADYQAGNESKDSPWHGIAEIKRQCELNRSIAEISGEMHFRYKFLVQNSELYEYYRGLYRGETYTAEPEKELFAHKAYMQGAGNRFNPDGRLTRAEAAMLFARLMTDEEGNALFSEGERYPCSFSDVSSDAWYAGAIGFMEQHKVLGGYSDGTYQPEKTITRAEFSAVVARFENAQTAGGATGFSDVPETHWAAPYIASAVEKGYISGYGGGIFKPENQITRAETVKIVNRMLRRSADKAYIDKHSGVNAFVDITPSHWAYYEVMEASFDHEYSAEDGKEAWDDGKAPQIPFVSDTFKFVFPELRTTGELTPLDLGRVKHIALHHMAHPTADFRTVEGWHLDQGWRAFGYNFFIDFEGNVHVGRGWNVGAGVANRNSTIISIGFQGEYEQVKTDMPEAQYRAGVELIKWISRRVPTIYEVGGHGDYGSTLCPGKYFPLEEMKSDAGF